MSSWDAPLDIRIYTARTRLEKTMIKSTSHYFDVLFPGQSVSSAGYDDPSTTESILFTRGRPMFNESMVDDMPHHDLFFIRSYVASTHDCLRKRCNILLVVHHCMNGTVTPSMTPHPPIFGKDE